MMNNFHLVIHASYKQKLKLDIASSFVYIFVRLNIIVFFCSILPLNSFIIKRLISIVVLLLLVSPWIEKLER